jgi:hypothetical protein
MIINVKLAIEGWSDSFDAVKIRLVFAYTGVVPTARSCSVSFTDSEGISHAVEIMASTLYESSRVGAGRVPAMWIRRGDLWTGDEAHRESAPA